MKKFLYILLVLIIAVSVSFTGCMAKNDDDTVYVVSITSTGTNSNNESVFKVTYSDGKYNYFTIKNGEDGQNGNDGQDVTIDEIYQKYCDEVENIPYEDFLNIYFGATEITIPEIDASKEIAKAVSTTLTVYSTSYIANGISAKTSLSSGTAVIYKIDNDFVYAITNYHVIYNKSNVDSLNNGKLAKYIHGYLYGSEDTPYKTGSTDANGCEVLAYGDYAIEFEYVGGSITHDLALIKASKADVLI